MTNEAMSRRLRFFICKDFKMALVRQNPCGCHPFDLLIEVGVNKRVNSITISGAKDQDAIESYLKWKFATELM